LIREEDLLEAIAECQGERDPNANTCIKLGAFYTILDHIRPKEPEQMYSFAEPPRQVSYDSGSEFSDAVMDKDINDVMAVMDELMDTIQVLAPRIYTATIERLKR